MMVDEDGVLWEVPDKTVPNVRIDVIVEKTCLRAQREALILNREIATGLWCTCSKEGKSVPAVAVGLGFHTAQLVLDMLGRQVT